MAKGIRLNFLDVLYVIGAVALVVLIFLGSKIGNTLPQVISWYVSAVALLSIIFALRAKNILSTVLWIIVFILFLPALRLTFITATVMQWVRGFTALLMLILAFVKR